MYYKKYDRRAIYKNAKKKKKIINNTINNKFIITNLTFSKFLKLFNLVVYNENNKPFIFVNNEFTNRLIKSNALKIEKKFII